MTTTIITKSLAELRQGDVIIDPQGNNHILTEPVIEFLDEDGEGFKVYTDTYPRGGVMDGRTIYPIGGPRAILFQVLVTR